jgi:hypothetical protein
LKQDSVRALYQNGLGSKLDNDTERIPEEMYDHMKKCIFEAAYVALDTENKKTKIQEEI